MPVSLSIGAIGFSFLPSGWSSFKNCSLDITNTNSSISADYRYSYSHVSLALILVMQFVVCIGISIIPFILISEVFPFRLRSMLCSITTASRYIFAAISSKLYYNIEMWLSLPGSAAFYGFISLTG